MCGPNSKFKEHKVLKLWQLVLQINVKQDEDFIEALERKTSVFDCLDHPVLLSLLLHFIYSS